MALGFVWGKVYDWALLVQVVVSWVKKGSSARHEAEELRGG